MGELLEEAQRQQLLLDPLHPVRPEFPVPARGFLSGQPLGAAVEAADRVFDGEVVDFHG